MKVTLASNGYITDDNGDLYVYTEHDKHIMYNDILHDIEKALIEHGEVEVEVKITPYKRNEDLLTPTTEEKE